MRIEIRRPGPAATEDRITDAMDALHSIKALTDLSAFVLDHAASLPQSRVDLESVVRVTELTGRMLQGVLSELDVVSLELRVG